MRTVKFTFTARYYKTITTEMEIPENTDKIDYIDHHFDREEVVSQDLEFEDYEIELDEF